MKKFTFAIVAMAAMMFASCGNKAQQPAADDVDTTKTFEQEQIEASIKMHLDSIAAAMNEKDLSGIAAIAKEGKLTLSADEKKVQPVYLLSANIADELTTIGQKYAAIAMLAIDKEVAKVYDMNIEDYDATIAKLASDINDPAIKKLHDAEINKEALAQLSKDMDEEGRINFFWIASSAATVENLYIMSQNVEKFLASYTDEQVSNITFRLFCLLDAMDRLSVYDPQIVGIAEGLEPLKNLNATTVEEFKKELTDSKEMIEASRAAFLK
ncbi:MAG: hypothetical protein MJZ12_05250 [Prevotella sp.]|nr:hypothetical protein [Prevotella sp.]